MVIVENQERCLSCCASHANWSGVKGGVNGRV